MWKIHTAVEKNYLSHSTLWRSSNWERDSGIFSVSKVKTLSLSTSVCFAHFLFENSEETILKAMKGPEDTRENTRERAPKRTFLQKVPNQEQLLMTAKALLLVEEDTVNT